MRLKSEYIKFILENPIEEIEEHHETAPSPSQQLDRTNHQHQEAPPQPFQHQPSQAPTQPLHHQPSQAPTQPFHQQPSHQPTHYAITHQPPPRTHLPQRQHSRPLPPRKGYSSLAANAFDN